MFKWLESRILWGGLLILGGVLFLLQNLGVLEIGGLFWVILLALGGVFFLSIFIENRLNWWALIPSFSLFGVAVAVLLGYVSATYAELLGGPAIFLGVGLSFLTIYLLHREMWWAIIPGGALVSLAATIFVSSLSTGTEGGGVFMLGLGATFAGVGLAPVSGGRMGWPWIPAGILGAIGLILLATSGAAGDYLMPVAMIVGGLVLVYFALRPRRHPKEE